MRDEIIPRLPKWPFLIGNALLLGLAVFICVQSRPPMNRWEILACVFCFAAGAGLGMLPYLSEYRATVRLAEARNLAASISQIQRIEQLAAQISAATGQWQTVSDAAGKTAKTAQEIAAGMAAELKSFNEFLQRANDTERATLRLEVDKARRGETEWLQVVVRMLDHVFALHQAALRSGQPALIEQLGAFQNACRDAARRVGLTPFAAGPAEAFNAQRHQVVDGSSAPPAGAIVDETIATGYTFQGRLLRPVLVRLRERGGAGGSSPDSEDLEAAADVAQSQLPLGR